MDANQRLPAELGVFGWSLEEAQATCWWPLIFKKNKLALFCHITEAKYKIIISVSCSFN